MSRKYASLFLASLFATGSLSAAPIPLDKDGPICSSTLCAFNAPGGFYVGVTGYYVKPGETGIGQVTDSWQYAVPGGVQARSKPVNPKTNGAGSVTVGYDFPMSANNAEFTYFRLSNDNHAVNGLADGPISFGSVFFPDVGFGPLPPGFVSNAHLRYTLNQFDLKVGRKYTDLTRQFSVKPSLGIRYAKLEHKLTFVQPGNLISDFDGIGPLFTVDGNYAFNNTGFGLVGRFEYALIVGDINSHSYVNLGGFNFSFTSPKRDRIMNSVTGKIGVDYNHMFTNASSVNLELGYQVSEYINGIDIIRGNIGAIPGTVQRIAGIETTSFSFRGPYLSLTVHA